MKKEIKKILNFLHLDITKNLKYDRLTKKLLKEVLKKDSNCIDIGCHKGEILDMIFKFSPNGNHIAFEPIPFLHKNLIEKNKNRSVEIYNCALSDTEGKATFNIVKNALGHSGLKERKYDVKKPDIEKTNVKVNVLDNLIDENYKVDLIKIDVEGAEFNVLKGAFKTLKKDKPVLIFEFGLGASDFYNVSPLDFFNFITKDVGLNLYILEAFLGKKSYLTIKEFENHYNLNDVYYFVASS